MWSQGYVCTNKQMYIQKIKTVGQPLLGPLWTNFDKLRPIWTHLDPFQCLTNTILMSKYVKEYIWIHIFWQI